MEFEPAQGTLLLIKVKLYFTLFSRAQQGFSSLKHWSKWKWRDSARASPGAEHPSSIMRNKARETLDLLEGKITLKHLECLLESSFSGNWEENKPSLIPAFPLVLYPTRAHRAEPAVPQSFCPWVQLLAHSAPIPPVWHNLKLQQKPRGRKTSRKSSLDVVEFYFLTTFLLPGCFVPWISW